MRKNMNQTEKITVKFTEDEKSQFDAEASEKGVNRSELIRQKIFAPNQTDDALLQKQYIHQLKMANLIGNMINQLRALEQVQRKDLLKSLELLQKEVSAL